MASRESRAQSKEELQGGGPVSLPGKAPEATWRGGCYSDLWIIVCLFLRSLQLIIFVKFPVTNCIGSGNRQTCAASMSCQPGSRIPSQGSRSIGLLPTSRPWSRTELSPLDAQAGSFQGTSSGQTGVKDSIRESRKPQVVRGAPGAFDVVVPALERLDVIRVQRGWVGRSQRGLNRTLISNLHYSCYQAAELPFLPLGTRDSPGSVPGLS